MSRDLAWIQDIPEPIGWALQMIEPYCQEVGFPIAKNWKDIFGPWGALAPCYILYLRGDYATCYVWAMNAKWSEIDHDGFYEHASLALHYLAWWCEGKEDTIGQDLKFQYGGRNVLDLELDPSPAGKSNPGRRRRGSVKRHDWEKRMKDLVNSGQFDDWFDQAFAEVKSEGATADEPAASTSDGSA